jgi:DNA-directed RNA polymerase subunit alpha
MPKLSLRDQVASLKALALLHEPEPLKRHVLGLELSTRCYNCLRNSDVQTVGELVQMAETKMLKTRNCPKSLNEIKEILSSMGLTLGIKIVDGNAVPGPTSNQVLPASAYGPDL